MVIIITPQGQFANRIIHLSHFIANAIENNYTIYHLCFEEYYPFFKERLQSPSSQKHVRFINIRNIFIKRIVHIIAKIIRKVYKYNNGKFLLFKYIYLPAGLWKTAQFYDLSSDDFVKSSKKITFVDGWEFRNDLLLKKHRKEIIRMLTPNTFFCELAKATISKHKKENDFIIGVHIRKGDYKEFNDGKYFYEDELYREKMIQMKNSEIFTDKKILFIICSNENINKSRFTGLNIDFSNRHFLIDFLLLSDCDYIIGPPSTFSMWASYYGNTPLNYILPGENTLKINDFKICFK